MSLGGHRKLRPFLTAICLLASSLVVILASATSARADITQDWQVAVTGQPAASTPVGSTVTVQATISVDPGAHDLSVNSLSSGAATSGLDEVSFTDSTPFTVAADTTKTVTATARVVGPPGSGGIKLEMSLDGSLGSVDSTKTADSDVIASTEAVTATLTGAPAHIDLADQITYTLTLTNDSDTAAQVDVPAVGFGAPTGSTLESRTTGSAVLLAHSATGYELTVDVDDADADGATITQAPTGVTYGMSDIPLASRAIAVTSATSTVQAPVVTVGPHTLTDHNGGALLAGDTVDVSVTVKNNGAADTSATLADTLTNLQSPASIQVDGSACGACSSTSTTVTAPLGLLPAAGTHVMTYSATVDSVPDGTPVSSSSVVSFNPATTGTSPTTADVASLTVHQTPPQNPTITAHVSSTHPKTKFGWYRSNVTIKFTCTTHGAPLVGACPAPVTLTHNGAAQSVSRTIKATNGGTASVTVHGISIDHTAPTVKVSGVTNGGKYGRPGPSVGCRASDALSGVATCTLTQHSTTSGNKTTVHATATAADQAGNVSTAHVTYQLLPRTSHARRLSPARAYAHAAFQVL
jgi:hypothetical protein